jgi:hypothetical protein
MLFAQTPQGLFFFVQENNFFGNIIPDFAPPMFCCKKQYLRVIPCAKAFISSKVNSGISTLLFYGLVVVFLFRLFIAYRIIRRFFMQRYLLIHSPSFLTGSGWQD